VTCIKIKNNNREVYKKLLHKGEKYKISTTHHVIGTKKNDVTAESMTCKKWLCATKLKKFVQAYEKKEMT
jgi:hypothetical protein